jgi:hypothetical protein
VADIQHFAITDPNIHEPKGIASATAGKVYTANGSGSGTWLLPAGHAYGELYIQGGATAQALAAASALAKLNPTGEWTVNGNKNITLSAGNGTITAVHTGKYKINFHVIFETTAISSGATYNFHYNINGTSSPRKVYVKKTSNAAETLFISGTGLTTLAAADVLSIYVGGDGTSSGANITVKEAGFSAVLIDPA